MRIQTGVLAGVLIAVLAASFAQASPDLADRPPTTVAPLTVYPKTDPPRIVSSFPAEGQVIAPGVLVVRVTFDQQMDEHRFVFGAAPGGQMPRCLKTPRLLNDNKSFVLLCTAAAKTAYAFAFNAEPQGGFANVAGTAAVPAMLAFSTDDSSGPRDLEAALKVSGLTSGDVPIAVSP